MQNIANAIGAYQLQFRAYPGALANSDVMSATNPNGIRTSSEDLLVSLVGGLINTANPGQPTVINYNLVRLGTGPRNLKDNQGKQYPPFIEGVKWTDPALAHFTDGSGFVATDTNVPEFLDGYDADPLPVLYLRANVGKTRVVAGKTYFVSEDLNTQYDASELYPYTQQLGGGTKHGLRALGTDPVTDPIDPKNPNNAYPYFRSTTLSGSPRTPDGFILISAGPDRIFGTADDITSFGSVIP